MFKEQRDTCMNNLNTVLDYERMRECESFIKTRREARHQETLKRQMSKFERLCHRNTGACSNDQDGTLHVGANMANGRNKELRNIDHGLNITSSQGPNNTPAQGLDIDRNKANTWVRNLSKTPLTNAQKKVLAHRPKLWP